MELLSYLFLRLVGMSVTASVVILAVLLIRLILVRIPTVPKLFPYLLWGVVLFRLLCPFTFESQVSVFNLSPVSISGYTQYLASHPVQLEELIDGGENMPSQVTEIPADIAVETDADYSVPAVNRTVNFGVIELIIWLCGVSVMLAVNVVSAVRLRLKLRTAVQLRDNIYAADHIASPFVFGIIRPRIYLPSDIAADESEYIIMHEKHHIERFDHITKLLGFAALCLHWFNPLVWLAFRLAVRDMEMSCDEAVIRKLGGDIRADYSQSLLTMASKSNRRFGTLLAFGESDTSVRIKNVLSFRKPAVWVAAVCVILFIAVGAVFVSDARSDGGSVSDNDAVLPFDGVWKVSEVVYQAPYLSMDMTPEFSPIYSIGRGGVLASKFGDVEWSVLGALEEIELDGGNFDGYFAEYDNPGIPSGWMSGVTAMSIRHNNARAWCALNGDADGYGITYVLQQNDGTVYICSGSYDTDSDKGYLQRMFRMEKDDALMPYGANMMLVTQKCLYMTPISSEFSNGDNGVLYRIDGSKFTIMDRHSGAASTFFLNLQWQDFPYTDEEWDSMFMPFGNAGYRISEHYEVLKYIPVSKAYFLVRADDELWFVRLHGDTIWSIYTLVPLESMGSAAWMNAPYMSSVSPYFEFEFDFEYDHITAVCNYGELHGQDKSMTDMFPGAYTNYYHHGDKLQWSAGYKSIPDKAEIHLTALRKDGLSVSLTIYIERDTQNSSAGRTYYTAYPVGGNVVMSQSEYDGAVIRLIEN